MLCFPNAKINLGLFVTEKREDDHLVCDKYRVNPPNVYGFGHTEYLNDVVTAIKSGSSALVQGLEGRRSLELVTAIYESIETGKEVFVPFSPKQCRLGLKT